MNQNQKDKPLANQCLGPQIFPHLAAPHHVLDMIADLMPLCRYKGLGASVVDKAGTPDNNEQYWIGCGDIDGNGRSRAMYNDVINSRMEQLKEFIDCGKAVTDKFLMIFSAILGISPDSKDFLPNLHSHSNNSGSHVRLLKCPPKPEGAQVNLQPQ